jgi:hypothetical protein
MDELVPDLNDLLSPTLTEEYDLTSTHNINFWSYWLMDRGGGATWICDVHSDRVTVSRGPTVRATDPDFMKKFHNAVWYAISSS